MRSIVKSALHFPIETFKPCAIAPDNLTPYATFPRGPGRLLRSEAYTTHSIAKRSFDLPVTGLDGTQHLAKKRYTCGRNLKTHTASLSGTFTTLPEKERETFGRNSQPYTASLDGAEALEPTNQSKPYTASATGAVHLRPELKTVHSIAWRAPVGRNSKAQTTLPGEAYSSQSQFSTAHSISTLAAATLSHTQHLQTERGATLSLHVSRKQILLRTH